MNLLKWLQHRSLQIVLVIGLYLMTASLLPMWMHQTFFMISLFIKDLLIWMLPITVAFFIAYAISSFEKRAPLFILALFLFEAISNSLSVWYSYGCGHLCASFLSQTAASQPMNESFEPLWRLTLTKPSWWSADKGTFVGIILGLIASFSIPPLKAFVQKGKRGSEIVLTRFFSPLIPLFILGFVARMVQTHLFDQLFVQYADLLISLCGILIVYIAFLFLLGSGFSFLNWVRNVKNVLPAGGIAFSSGSSLSTMPWTIEGVSKNMQNPDLAKAVIPATTNIQQIGDCIANSFICFLLYLHFNGVAPSLSTWAAFSIVFVMARFATAAVLGGAIFIMLPIYESYLGFTPEMIATILAFNVILDPIVTATNVMANGALCRVFERVWNFRRVLS